MSESRLLVFVCNFCSYGGADKAGGLRLDYPAGARLVRVMCSGRVDPQLVLHGFRAGADGVLILGCHPGDCHFKEGNHHAARRAALLAAFLEQHGIERQRFGIDWVSAGEGERLQRVVTDFYAQIAALPRLQLARQVPPMARPTPGPSLGSERPTPGPSPGSERP
jgi:F420-non-reducing hydrogenase iron-sulfur subunit